MKLIWSYGKDTIKLVILFLLCTTIFYLGLTAMQSEYQNYHRYDPPEGKAIKVMNQEEQSFVDRFAIFLRLGE
ncbi:hypothetical protein J2T56_000416 [Natronobacillus azotifigens]|uniref:DUF4227 family protein n=1 Tax=Natronobacillus azotifigens TaxID=472978 RepID=A0A9J6R954_9BACI|nr:DUF4227 family protein [Natronobacillus azotifigens]MCZ0701809.1 DUF4227 family protein [Natronobacillus azotifigens]